MVEINKYQKFLIEKKAKLKELIDEERSLKSSVSDLKILLDSCIEARDLVSSVGILAQKEIKEVIEELVTQALQAIFGKGYSFVVEDVINRNKPETNFYVCENGCQRSLKNELGGGIVDLVAFVLRVILWAITVPRSTDTLIFDEPLRFLDKNRLELAGDMVKKLSETLKVQLIIVSHEDQLINAADAAFYVEKVKDYSVVEKVNG